MTWSSRVLRAVLLAAPLVAVACVHTPKGPELSAREKTEQLIAQGAWAKALPELEALHQAAPDDLELARQLTQAHVRTHRAEELIARLEQRTEKQKRSEVVTLYMLGLARFAGPSQADRAIADFEQAAKLAPEEAEFHYRHGLALLESEQYPRARPPLERAHQLAPSRRDVLLPLAKARFRTGDRANAISSLRALVESGPSPREVQTARAIMGAISDPFVTLPQSAKQRFEEGVVWLQDRDVPQQAIIKFEEILLEYPDLAVVHALLGLSYQRIDDAGRAVEEFKRAIELSPDEGRNHLYLGMLYLSRQRDEQALPWFERALTHDPLLDDAWAAVGEHHLNRRELDKARKAFFVLSHLQPESPPARGKHALVLQLLGDYSAADRELRAVLEQQPENVEFMLRLGVLHLERRRAAKSDTERAQATTEAEIWLRKVLEAQPENAVASRALEALRTQ